jgi:hypothetical protein
MIFVAVEAFRTLKKPKERKLAMMANSIIWTALSR